MSAKRCIGGPCQRPGSLYCSLSSASRTCIRHARLRGYQRFRSKWWCWTRDPRQFRISCAFNETTGCGHRPEPFRRQLSSVREGGKPPPAATPITPLGPTAPQLCPREGAPLGEPGCVVVRDGSSSISKDERHDANTKKASNDVKGGAYALEQGRQGHHGCGLNLHNVHLGIVAFLKFAECGFFGVFREVFKLVRRRRSHRRRADRQ